MMKDLYGRSLHLKFPWLVLSARDRLTVIDFVADFRAPTPLQLQN